MFIKKINKKRRFLRKKKAAALVEYLSTFATTLKLTLLIIQLHPTGNHIFEIIISQSLLSVEQDLES